MKKRITIVGCGGTGGHLVHILGDQRLHLMDGDRVEQGNLARQGQFVEHDIGLNKARVLAGERHTFYDSYVTPDTQWDAFRRPDVVILAVDNHYTRRIVLQKAYARATCPPVINVGNELLGAAAEIVLPEWRGGFADPLVAHPEIMEATEPPDDHNVVHCGERVKTGEQSVEANMAAALMAAGLVRTWILDPPERAYHDLIPYMHTMVPSRWTSITRKMRSGNDENQPENV